MSQDLIFLIFMIIVLAIFVIVGIIYHGKLPKKSIPNGGTSSIIQSSLLQYVSPNTWSAPLGSYPQGSTAPSFIDVPGGTRNTCGLYTFPGGISSGGQFSPGTPTLNPLVLDSLTPVVSTEAPQCLDVDQIYARQIYQECVFFGDIHGGSPTGSTSTLSMCYLPDGTIAPVGTTAIFYDSSQCGTIDTCSGSLGVVSLDFGSLQTSPDIPLMCIQQQGPGNTASLASCDPSNPQQVFRITRKGITSSPPQAGVQSNTGFLAQLLDRTTGMCLVPLLGPSGLSGPSGTAVPVILSDCSPGDGYVWGLIPSFVTGTVPIPGEPPYSSKCCGPTNENDYPLWPSGQQPTTCPSGSYCSSQQCDGELCQEDFCCQFMCPSECYGPGNYLSIQSPPQIAYVGSVLNITKIPDISTLAELQQYLINNDVLSMYPSGVCCEIFGGTIQCPCNVENPWGPQGTVVLTPIVLDSTGTNQTKDAQYLDFTLYNLIAASPNTSF